ncbi:MAG: hypothetical protein ABGZ53_06305, partial [Fuerstiella sp.]
FSVKDAAAGRRVKCRECGAPIKVPVPKTDEGELLNFDAAAYGDDASTGTQPLPRRRKKKVKSSSDSAAVSGGKWNLENPLVWFVVPFAAALLVFLTTMMHLRIGGSIAMLIGSVAGCVAFVASLMIVIHAFGESGLAGLLCLFVPFYILYWVATEWHATKKMFLVQVVAGLTVMATYFSFSVAFGIWITEAISTYNEIQEREVQDTEDAPNGNNDAEDTLNE